MKDDTGFTLIEVIIAMFILSFGIIAASAMQMGAIQGNNSASYRSAATHLGLSFLEELKRMDFDDTSSYLGKNVNAVSLDDGKAEASAGQVLPNSVDHQFVPGDFPSFASSYQLVGTTLIDNKGHQFTIFWNVNYETTAGSPVESSSGIAPYCTIRLFIYWNNPTGAGRNHLEFTTTKYNNIKV